MAKSVSTSEKRFRIACISPAIGVLIAVNIFPLLWLLYLSFTEFSTLKNKPPVFIGVKNYGDQLVNSKTHEAFFVTMKFVLMAVSLELILGMALAVLLNRLVKSRQSFMTVLVFPMMLSSAVVSNFAKNLFDSSFGLVNWCLKTVGLMDPLKPINWGDKDHALWSIVMVDVFMWTPFVMLIAAAALASVPKELHEAAAVDRCNNWNKFWRIIVPIISPVLAVAAILRLLDCLRMFDIAKILTNGGPGSETENLPLYLAKIAIQFGYTGKAAALTILFLIVINILTKRAAGVLMGEQLSLKLWIRNLLLAIAGAALFWALGWQISVGIIAFLFLAWGLTQFPEAVKKPLTMVSMVALTLGSFVPILWVVLTSLKQRSEIFSDNPFAPFTVFWGNYQSLFFGGDIKTTFPSQILGSLLVGIAATVVTVFCGTLAAYAFSRYAFKGKNDLLFFILSTKMLPAIAVVIPITILYRDWKLMGTHHGLAILYVAMNMALAVWIMKAFIDKVPHEYEEAAVMEQCTPAQAFYHAVLPSLWPAILTTTLFCFLACWNEYAFSMFLSTSQQLTAPPAITSVLGTGGIDWGYIGAGSTILMIPALILTILARKTILLGVSFGSVDSK